MGNRLSFDSLVNVIFFFTNNSCIDHFDWDFQEVNKLTSGGNTPKPILSIFYALPQNYQ